MSPVCPDCGVHPANGHLFGCPIAAEIARRRRPPTAMAMTVSPAEQAHIEAVRLRSYEYAVERGHVRR